MPLDPKQQPPYYTPGTTPTPPTTPAPQTILLLTQSGTSNPTLVNIKNELTFLTPLRASTGVYTLDFLLGTLTANKTVITIGTSFADTTVVAVRINTTQIQIQTYTAGTLADSNLADTPIIITVYP